ncbi:GDP-L-fucose synthase [Patescibacteria group bacterium]|nr:GDP-L-fucose synthase [Patescibacteria group bacterium]
MKNNSPKNKVSIKENFVTLVTGSNGLVGSALRQLNPQNTVFTVRQEVDLTNFSKSKSLFKKVKPNRVIHLAAVVAGIGGNMMHSGSFFRKNLMININVLESARLAGTKKLISFMSTCIFPDNAPYPLHEKNIHDGPPHPSNFGYAYAKRMLQVQSDAYRKEWNCNYIVAIPTNIYGPHDIFNLEEGHVVPSLIHKCYLAMKNRTPLEVWGSGKPLREFVYSEDIAKLSLWAVDNYEEDTPIIFSSGKEISIRDLVDLITKSMHFKGEIIFDSSKPDGQFRKPSDTSKLKKYLPNFEWTPVEKGIKKTVEWFLANYPNVRL